LAEPLHHPMIDLHLHTTVSDGRLTPSELVQRCADVGLTIIAVTDHDTTAGIDDARRFGREHGIDVVNGIEITAVQDGVDVHMLGYFFDATQSDLLQFLADQRANRLRRAEAIAARLAELGMPIDADAIIAAARQQTGRAVGRPQVARALIAAGHVPDMHTAFDRWLGTGKPAFVARTGPSPADVVAIVHRAGGIVSMAHPGRTNLDELIAPLATVGMDAIEAYHSDHDEDTVIRYRAMAESLGLLVTGGSDFHGDPARVPVPGAVTLPEADWHRLAAAQRTS
jgi:predicted metal-dependent phosphoesterase TrpH